MGAIMTGAMVDDIVIVRLLQLEKSNAHLAVVSIIAIAQLHAQQVLLQ